MDGDVISRQDAQGRLHRLKEKSTQWRKTQYKTGWDDAIESAERAISNCKALEVQTVVRCSECLHAVERESTMVYCAVYGKRRGREDFCNLGIPTGE